MVHCIRINRNSKTGNMCPCLFSFSTSTLSRWDTQPLHGYWTRHCAPLCCSRDLSRQCLYNHSLFFHWSQIHCLAPVIQHLAKSTLIIFKTQDLTCHQLNNTLQHSHWIHTSLSQSDQQRLSSASMPSLIKLAAVPVLCGDMEIVLQ